MAKSQEEKDYDRVVFQHISGKSIPEISEKTGLDEEKVRGHILDYFRSL